MRLALDTSTYICSVAYEAEDKQVYEKRIEAKGSHSEMLFVFIEELMQEHRFRMEELDALLVSEGPGSYTGLRISASAVKGLLFQKDVPLLAANTLASYAAAALTEYPEVNTVHSIIDARRVHLYHQSFIFQAGKIEPRDSIEVIPIKKFEKMIDHGDVIIGTGLGRVSSGILDKCTVMDSNYITARSLFSLSDMEDSDLSGLVRAVEVSGFEPRYHTSGQVNS